MFSTFLKTSGTMWLVTFGLGAITALLLYLHWWQTRSHFAKLLNKFPSTPYYPLIGHIIDFSSKPDVLFPQVRKFLNSFSETLVAWSVYYGSLHIVTADDAEIMLSSTKHIDKSDLYAVLLPWLGEGLLTSTGSKWQQRRKILTPTFHFNILRRFVDIFGEHSDILGAELKEKVKQDNVINIVPYITHLTLGTICETAMGTKLNKKDKVQKKYLQALYDIAPLMVKRILTPLLYSDIVFYLSPTGWNFRKYLNILHTFTNNVITEREGTFKDSDIDDAMNSNEDDDGTKKKRLAMLDLLISAKKNRNEIDHEGIREEVDTFMFEGHDTTSMAICFALMELSLHYDVQEKIIAELDQIFGDDTRYAGYEDLQNMKYLEICIKECLRLYPSVPLISRYLTEDTQFTHHVAPGGSIVFVHIYNIHRDPKYFPDPEKFDPERFSPENCKGRHPYAYVPFSAGPRNCIGQKYAMLELKSVISSIFRNFRLQPISTAASVTWLIDLVLRVKGPINIKFIPRN